MPEEFRRKLSLHLQKKAFLVEKKSRARGKIVENCHARTDYDAQVKPEKL
jgi:hypothetical protein